MDLDFAVSPMTRLRLRELVKEWHEQIEEAHPDRLEQTAGKLASGLELPRALATLPSRVRGLTVVPDDALHGFPFAALPINGRPLVEDFAVSLAFDHTPPPATARRRTTGEALVAAVVRGANEAAPLPGGRIYRSLPGTEPEARHVGEWLTAHGLSVRLFIDDADRTAVLEWWRRADFIHIACHGIFEPDRPDASGLAPIPRPECVEMLSLRDLSRLEGASPEHVTLSSCWGADNFMLPGRRIVSLPETLCRSGARSVLACLWPIDDVAGQAFHKSFYRHLETLPRDQALQAAQREFLADPARVDSEGEWTGGHPKHWAGYQLYGAHGRLPMGGVR